MGLFDIFKKKRKIDENFTDQPSPQLFQKVYDGISNYLPEEWKRVAIYYAVVNNMVDFKYYVDLGNGYLDCFKLKNFSKEKFRTLRFGVDDILLKDRKRLQQDKRWSVFTMFISSTGKFETNFSYDNISEDFHKWHENWEKENITNK